MSPARGLPFVVAAPSGTGKTTVCREVLARDPRIRFSVSHTTRSPRPGEREGRDYHFVSEEDFLAGVRAGDFLEHAEYSGNRYGTSWRSLEEPLEQGYDLLLEIEVQGARQVHARLEDVRLVFLLPPSLEELEQRLRSRGTDSDAQVERRLAQARSELEAVHLFDYAIVNDDLGRAVGALLEIVHAERSGEVAGVRRRHGRDRVWADWTRGAA